MTYTPASVGAFFLFYSAAQKKGALRLARHLVGCNMWLCY